MFVFSPTPLTGSYTPPIGPLLFSLISDSLLGLNLNLLVSNILFFVPFLSVVLKMAGCLPKQKLVETLKKSRSVILSHDDEGKVAKHVKLGENENEQNVIVKNREFIRVALMSGAQVVPSFCFTSSPPFGKSLLRGLLPNGKFGLPIPRRSNLLIALGRPIQCPLVCDPSSEMILEYHETFLRETRRIYDKYKNMIGLDAPLTFHR